MFRAPLRASLEAVRGSSRPDLAETGVATPALQPSWPWARLASLHHRSPRGLRPPAMALLRFGVSTALEARPIAHGSSVPLALPPAGFVPHGGFFPARPCRRIHVRRRSRDFPLEACPRPDRYRFPGPCPLAVPRRLSIRSNARRFRASIPGRSRPQPWKDCGQLPQGSPLGSSPPPPWLSVSFPGHPLLRFPRRLPCACVERRSRVLRSGGIGLPSPAADPSGFFDLSVLRGSSPAPNSCSRLVPKDRRRPRVACAASAARGALSIETSTSRATQKCRERQKKRVRQSCNRRSNSSCQTRRAARRDACAILLHSCPQSVHACGELKTAR